jgi:hypothetical protein
MLKAKILGKPYAGKLHVRFDEGEEEAKVSKCGLTLYRLPSSFLLYCESERACISLDSRMFMLGREYNNIIIHSRFFSTCHAPRAEP